MLYVVSRVQLLTNSQYYSLFRSFVIRIVVCQSRGWSSKQNLNTYTYLAETGFFVRDWGLDWFPVLGTVDCALDWLPALDDVERLVETLKRKKEEPETLVAFNERSAQDSENRDQLSYQHKQIIFIGSVCLSVVFLWEVTWWPLCQTYLKVGKPMVCCFFFQTQHRFLQKKYLL